MKMRGEFDEEDNQPKLKINGEQITGRRMYFLLFGPVFIVFLIGVVVGRLTSFPI